MVGFSWEEIGAPPESLGVRSVISMGECGLRDMSDLSFFHHRGSPSHQEPARGACPTMPGFMEAEMDTDVPNIRGYLFSLRKLY